MDDVRCIVAATVHRHKGGALRVGVTGQTGQTRTPRLRVTGGAVVVYVAQALAVNEGGDILVPHAAVPFRAPFEASVDPGVTVG